MSQSITNRIAQAHHQIREMEETLQGCDWCCGGGTEHLAHLRKEIARLNALLPAPSKWCDGCQYLPPEEGKKYCRKCLESPGIETNFKS